MAARNARRRRSQKRPTSGSSGEFAEWKEHYGAAQEPLFSITPFTQNHSRKFKGLDGRSERI